MRRGSFQIGQRFFGLETFARRASVASSTYLGNTGNSARSYRVIVFRAIPNRSANLALRQTEKEPSFPKLPAGQAVVEATLGSTTGQILNSYF